MAPTLRGGRKTVKAEIRRGNRLGGNGEGHIFEAYATVKKNGKEKTVRLAEKEFFDHRFGEVFQNYRHPRGQFKIMGEIRELNKREKLGLHILPTTRLKKGPSGKKTLILTRYTEVNRNRLSQAKFSEIQAQEERDCRVLKAHGYRVGDDAFKIIKDPITGKPAFYIVDFGTIEKIPQEKKR